VSRRIVILVVEDSTDLREAYAAHLEGQGFEVVQAGDGMEALSLAKSHPPSLVLLDIGLPRLDGFYLAELWKRDPFMRHVPLIAISAFTEGDYERRALRAGCAAALRKPCSPAEVSREIYARIIEPPLLQ
jgi:two-component system cell cycle response regulator DivK